MNVTLDNLIAIAIDTQGPVCARTWRAQRGLIFHDKVVVYHNSKALIRVDVRTRDVSQLHRGPWNDSDKRGVKAVLQAIGLTY